MQDTEHTLLTRRAFLLKCGAEAAALTVLGLTAGCGGGSSSGSGQAGGTQFTPNYTSVITSDHWQALPVRVFFANDTVITPQGGNATHVNDIIRAGFDRWGAATNGIISYVTVPNAAQANITVSTVIIPRPSGASETGSTSVDASGGILHEASTQIYIWPDITVDELNLGQRTTAAHEFGHMLGIAGHSNVSSDLMYPSHAPTADVPLSPRDINTIKTIYSSLFTQ